MLAYLVKLIAKIDPLKYLLSKAALTGRLAKWVMLLSEYGIEYVDKKAIKGQIIADQLAKAPLQDTTPMTFEFPDESLFNITAHSWKLYFDGSYTNHGSGVGILLVTPHGDTIPKSYHLLFPCTNNIAKYKALVIGLKMVTEWKIKELHVYGDYQAKDEKLIPYKRMVDDFKEYFMIISFEQIPRIENKAADAMATIASFLEIPENESRYEFLVESIQQPAYDLPKTHSICLLVRSDSPWYGNIYTYLKDNTFPADLSSNQHRTFICQTSRYTIIADTLYQRGLDGTLLCCLERENLKPPYKMCMKEFAEHTLAVLP